MGLDVTAYRGLTRIGFAGGPDEKPPPGTALRTLAVVWDWAEANFPGRAEGLERGAAYAAEEIRWAVSYSYGTHSAFRNCLARLVGRADTHAPPPGPFAEFLCFADNEGYIGPVVSAKLARDFAEHQHLVDASEDDFVREVYLKWRRAFEMAADRGAVSFH